MFAIAPETVKLMRRVLLISVVTLIALAGVDVNVATAGIDPILEQGSSSDAEVKFLQALLNNKLSPSPRLEINGKFEATTRDAVTKYQVANGLAADGIVGRDTWKSLYNIDLNSTVNISVGGVRILRHLLDAAGLKTATITSGVRTAADQARVMYENVNTRGVAHQKRLYGPNGDLVIDIYVANQAKPKDDVVSLMKAKIIAIGPSKVSKHCSETHDVFDVAPSTITDKTKFGKALKDAKLAGIISHFILPPADPAYHIECKKSHSISADIPVGEENAFLSDKPSSVVVLVHGVQSNSDVYSDFAAKIRRHYLKDAWLVKFDWSTEFLLRASNCVGHRANSVFGISDQGFVAVARLKEVVARIREAVGSDIPITVLSHSQGTIISMCALQEGMTVDNWILMGSPLSQDKIASGEDGTEIGLAAANAQTVVNCWSNEDDLANLKGGIGAQGMPESVHGIAGKFVSGRLDNIYDVFVKDVDHFADNSWWTMEWLQPSDDREWNGAISKERFLDLLAAKSDVPTSVTVDTFREIQAYASSGTRNGDWSRIFGDSDYDEFEGVFTLTPGMMSGIHFDDKRQCVYEVECLNGRCNTQAMFATWSDWDKFGLVTTVTKGNPTNGKLRSKYESLDGTVFLTVVNTGTTTAKIRCRVAAIDAVGDPWEQGGIGKELHKVLNSIPNASEEKTLNDPETERQLQRQLILHEGMRPTRYYDTEKHPTIGVGFNLDRSDARKAIEKIGLDYSKVRQGELSLSTEQALKLLSVDIEVAIRSAKSIFTNFDDLGAVRQRVLVDMAFNLGQGRLARFVKLKSAVESSDFEAAADEMQNSRWYEQVKERGTRLSAMMRTSELPKLLQ